MAARYRGWGGLVLGVCVLLLILVGWTQLQSRKSRANLERFEQWSTTAESAALVQPLVQHYLKNRQVAGPGDVTLPAVPKGIGVKAWALAEDSTLRVELDAKADGAPVVLLYVPIIRSANGAFYDCVSANAAIHIGKFCRSEVLRSVADIPTQLAANARALSEMPAVVSASGTTLAAGSATGSVVVTPPSAADLNNCGFQCVKPQSCVTPRPVACSKTVDEGNSRWLNIAATTTDLRGSSLATRTEADKVCQQSVGEGYRVLVASGISGVVQLAGDREYWVHNDLRPESNCWQADYR